jgi:type 1 glutamine amidotransferase
MRSSVAVLAVTVLLLYTFASFASAAEPEKKIAVLLVSGDDVGPAHDWRDISQATRDVLDDADRFDVRVCEDPAILESKKALEKYDVILLTMYNNSLPEISEAAKRNLLEFVAGGKGFVVQHLASASFKNWPEFRKLCGRNWVMGTSGHGPRGVFTANIVDREHPITKGMKDFRVYDELYAKLQGDAEIHPLITAESDWSKKTEPLLFVLPYGKGRTVHNAFGHDHQAIKDPNVKRLIRRGVEWAATGKVAAETQCPATPRSDSTGQVVAPQRAMTK